MKARSTTILVLALTMALVAWVTGRLEHPNVVPVYDIAEDVDNWRDEVVISDAPSDLEPAEPEPLTMSFELRHGETLHHYARWAGLPFETIAEASGLDLSGSYAAGVTVQVPVDSLEAMTTITTKREAHHTRRAEGYLASRGGAIGAEFVTVRTGDSATSIAREQMGIPLWLLQTYNPEANLDRLRPGQELMVPVLADIVVDAEDL